MTGTIFIVGFPGSGKTTFGRALAKRIGADFIDLDFMITQRFHTTVSQLFAERGEAEFRRIEAEMLRECGEIENMVIACGGGTPCFSGNMEYMNSRGLTVLLNARPERLAQRLELGKGRRPLVAGKSHEEILEYIAETSRQREPFYSQAQMVLESSELEDRRQIARTVDAFLPRLAGALGQEI